MKKLVQFLLGSLAFLAGASGAASQCDAVWGNPARTDQHMKALAAQAGIPGTDNYSAEKLGGLLVGYAKINCAQPFESLPANTRSPLGFLEHVGKTNALSIPAEISHRWLKKVVESGLRLGLPTAQPVFTRQTADESGVDVVAEGQRLVRDVSVLKRKVESSGKMSAAQEKKLAELEKNILGTRKQVESGASAASEQVAALQTELSRLMQEMQGSLGKMESETVTMAGLIDEVSQSVAVTSNKVANNEQKLGQVEQVVQSIKDGASQPLGYGLVKLYAGDAAAELYAANRATVYLSASTLLLALIIAQTVFNRRVKRRLGSIEVRHANLADDVRDPASGLAATRKRTEEVASKVDDALAITGALAGIEFSPDNPGLDVLEHLPVGEEHAVTWSGRHDGVPFEVVIWKEGKTPEHQVETNIVRSAVTRQRADAISIKRLKSRVETAVLDGRVSVKTKLIAAA